MVVRCPSVATYSYGGETLRWDSASPKSARLIRVYNASSPPHCAYCLVIIDACICERCPFNRDKREMGVLSLSLETLCFVQKKDESISRAPRTQRRLRKRHNKLRRFSARNYNTAYGCLLLGLSSKTDNHQDKLI
jgi:hypothetical protein